MFALRFVIPRGLQSAGDLLSAASRPISRERKWADHPARRITAESAYGCLVNHPFAVGNKRMALAAMATFLEMSGFTWTCGEVEETAMVLRAAAGEMQEDEWEAWVVRNVGKRE